MPIETYWANDKQSILIEKFRDDWTWQQVATECELVIRDQLDTVNHPVALIQDMIGSHWTPTFNLLQEVQEMMKTECPDNLTMIVVVSGDPSIDMLVVSAYKRYGQQHITFQSCTSVKQAMRIVSEHLS